MAKTMLLESAAVVTNVLKLTTARALLFSQTHQCWANRKVPGPTGLTGQSLQTPSGHPRPLLWSKRTFFRDVYMQSSGVGRWRPNPPPSCAHIQFKPFQTEEA